MAENGNHATFQIPNYLTILLMIMKNKNENDYLDVSIWAVVCYAVYVIHKKTCILHMKGTSHDKDFYEQL